MYDPKVVDLADQQSPLELQDAHIDAILEKGVGVTAGTHQSTQKKEYLHFKLL